MLGPSSNRRNIASLHSLINLSAAILWYIFPSSTYVEEGSLLISVINRAAQRTGSRICSLKIFSVIANFLQRDSQDAAAKKQCLARSFPRARDLLISHGSFSSNILAFSVEPAMDQYRFCKAVRVAFSVRKWGRRSLLSLLPITKPDIIPVLFQLMCYQL